MKINFAIPLVLLIGVFICFGLKQPITDLLAVVLALFFWFSLMIYLSNKYKEKKSDNNLD